MVQMIWYSLEILRLVYKKTFFETLNGLVSL
jgi:hypothetical protein